MCHLLWFHVPTSASLGTHWKCRISGPTYWNRAAFSWAFPGVSYILNSRNTDLDDSFYPDFTYNFSEKSCSYPVLPNAFWHLLVPKKWLPPFLWLLRSSVFHILIRDQPGALGHRPCLDLQPVAPHFFIRVPPAPRAPPGLGWAGLSSCSSRLARTVGGTRGAQKAPDLTWAVDLLWLSRGLFHLQRADGFCSSDHRPLWESGGSSGSSTGRNTVNGVPSLLAGIPAALKLLGRPWLPAPHCLRPGRPCKNPTSAPHRLVAPCRPGTMLALTTPEAAGVLPTLHMGKTQVRRETRKPVKARTVLGRGDWGKPRELLQWWHP